MCPPQLKPNGVPWHVFLHLLHTHAHISALSPERACGQCPWRRYTRAGARAVCVEQRLTHPGPSRQWPAPSPYFLGISQDPLFLGLELGFTAIKVSASSYKCTVKRPQACALCGCFVCLGGFLTITGQRTFLHGRAKLCSTYGASAQGARLPTSMPYCVIAF